MDGSRTLPKFENFDDQYVYSRDEIHVLSADSLNFVIEFDTDTAVAALDLSASSIQELLGVEV